MNPKFALSFAMFWIGVAFLIGGLSWFGAVFTLAGAIGMIDSATRSD